MFTAENKACRTTRGFTNLLGSHEDIVVKSKKIEHQRASFDFEIKIGNVEGRSQRYLNLRLTAKQETHLENFSSLLKSIRTLLSQVGGTITPVSDETALHRTTLLYPRINKIENKLRMLITKFMLMRVGIEWIKETLPAQIQNIGVEKSKKTSSFLHSTDFIHLGDFLFRPYSHENYMAYFQKIAKGRSTKDIKLRELRSVLPQSNWDRYFKKIIDCDGQHLEKQWKVLYEYRCQVAHNNFITENEFSSASEIIDELENIFNQALKKLNEISVPDEERKDVYESVAGSINENLGDFVIKWRTFENEIQKLYTKTHPSRSKTDRRPPLRMLQELHSGGFISEAVVNQTNAIRQFRNQMIHGPMQTVSETNLYNYSYELDSIIRSLKIVNTGENNG